MRSDRELEQASERVLLHDDEQLDRFTQLLEPSGNGHGRDDVPWPEEEPGGADDSGRSKLEAFPLSLVVPAAELSTMDIPEREELVEGLMFTRSLGMIFGPRGKGKTFLALSLANAIAAGTNFLTWRVPEARRILYIDGELPAVDLKTRVLAICGQAPSGNLELISSEFFYSTTKVPLTITNQAHQRRLVQLLEDLAKAGRGPEVVFFDNLSSMSYGTDENSNTEQDDILKFLLELRHRGYTIIVIHHTGKGGDQRGASRREDFLDISIKLADPDDDVQCQNARFILTFSKIRRKLPYPSSLECELIEVAAGKLDWSFDQPEPQDVEKRIVVLRFCQTMKPGSQKEISDRLGVKKQTLSRWVAEWEKDGHLKGLKVTQKGAEFLAKIYSESEGAKT